MVIRLDASDARDQIQRGEALGVKMVTVSPRDLLIKGGQYFFEQAAQVPDA